MEPPVSWPCWSTTAESGAPLFAELPAWDGATSLRKTSAPTATATATGTSANGIPTRRPKMRKVRLPRRGLRSLATASTSEPEEWKPAASGVKTV